MMGRSERFGCPGFRGRIPPVLHPPPPKPKNHPLVQIPLWYWFAFGAFVVTMLTLDLSLVHRHSRETSTREAAFWTLFWCFLAYAIAVQSAC